VGVTPYQAALIHAAQEYDLEHRSPLAHWTRVPDDQVLRLLTGAKLTRAADPPPRPCTPVDQFRWAFGFIRERYRPARNPE
jgi:hypothetical protein